MGLQRLTTEKQLLLVIASSDSSVPIGTYKLTPPHNLLCHKHLCQFCNSSSRLSKIKREELITTDKSKNTIALINNVKGKTKFERTCVAYVF